MIKIGVRQTLTIIRKVSIGAYLCDTADEGYKKDVSEEVLLPAKEVPSDSEVMDPIDVFIYRDSSDRLIATVRDPYIHLGEVKLLKVKQITKIGAFLDWGLEKDLLLPFKEQKDRPAEGDEVNVRMYVDKSGRLCASMWISDEEKKQSTYEGNAEKLKRILEENDGFLPINDHSDPEEIKKITKMSKKEFKRSAGNLYKSRLISIEENGIRLI